MAQDPLRCIVNSITQATSKNQIKSQLSGLKSQLSQQIGGPVQAGLAVLSQVSNAIRTGTTSIPGLQDTGAFNTAFGSITNANPSDIVAGGNVVYNTLGINTAAVPALSVVNPDTVNTANTQAQSIFQQVANGTFTSDQIVPSLMLPFQDLVNLAAQTVANVSGAIALNCQVSPYAEDLVGRAPKNKFMFVVQFGLNPPYSSIFNNFATGTAFVVKQSTRPNVEFEYDEVNMYNYRTRVPKRTIYQPMKLTFYDDNTNNVTQFYNSYLTAISPIANISSNTSPAQYELESMNDALSTISSASLGALQGDNVTFLNYINLYHVFQYGEYMTIYRFFNPKITNLSPDDLTMMESGNGSEMEIEFTYDALNIIPQYNLATGNTFNITDLTSGGQYPINPVFSASQKGQGNIADIAGTLITL